MAQWFFFTSAATSNSCDFSKLKHHQRLLCIWTLLINYSCFLLYKSNYHWHSTKSKQCIFSKHLFYIITTHTSPRRSVTFFWIMVYIPRCLIKSKVLRSKSFKICSLCSHCIAKLNYSYRTCIKLTCLPWHYKWREIYTNDKTTINLNSLSGLWTRRLDSPLDHCHYTLCRV